MNLSLSLLIGLLVLVIGAVGGTYWLGTHNQKHADELAQAKADLTWQSKIDAINARGSELAQKLSDAQAQVHTVYQTITKEIPHVVTVYRTAPGAPAVALPQCIFTRGFVGVWNHALDPKLSDASNSAAENATSAASADPLLKSDVEQGDVLANHVDNAERCNTTRSQLESLIAWHAIADRPH